MNKILVLNGSPRGNRGNTSQLVDLFLEGVISVFPTIEINKVELYKKDIKHCLGCFSCWTKTPGKCVIKDDMENLIEEYLSSDLIIWATPVYHYGMTSILKNFIERTLLINQPFIEKENKTFSHPLRFENIREKSNILISNCGFPSFDNFDLLEKSFEKILHNPLDEKIFCVMGELLSVKEISPMLKRYRSYVVKAGEEFAKENKISSKTSNVLNKTLIPTPLFLKMANHSWNKKLASVVQK